MRRTHGKSDPDQMPLDLSSREAERFALLRGLVLGQSSHAAHVRWFLETLAGIAGAGELKWKQERLAERLSLPLRTLRTVIATARRCGLVRSREVIRDNGTTAVSALSVAWDRIAARKYTRPGEESSSPAASAESSDSPGGAAAPAEPGGSQCRGERQRLPPGEAAIAEQLSLSPESPPPSPPIEANSDADWQAVEEEVSDAGVGKAASVVAKCRARGLTTRQVRELVAYRYEHAAGWEKPGGALWYRLDVANPKWPASECWSEWSAGYADEIERKRRRQAEQLAAAEKLERERVEAERRQQEEREAAERERTWGGRLDALEGSDRQALLEELSAFERRMAGSEWPPPRESVIRELLLGKLAQRAAAGAWLAGMHGESASANAGEP